MTTSSPSWMWKMNWKHLAKGDGRNKAGKKSWQGGHFHQKEAPKAAPAATPAWERDDSWEDDSWESDYSWERGWWRNWRNSWERGEWANSWERDDGWRVRDAWDEEEEEQEGGRKRRPPTPPKPKGRGRSRSSSNSSRGSRGSDVSMASSSRSRGPKVRREWRKKEEARLAWHESCNEKRGCAESLKKRQRMRHPWRREQPQVDKNPWRRGEQHQLHLQHQLHQ